MYACLTLETLVECPEISCLELMWMEMDQQTMTSFSTSTTALRKQPMMQLATRLHSREVGLSALVA